MSDTKAGIWDAEVALDGIAVEVMFGEVMFYAFSIFRN